MKQKHYQSSASGGFTIVELMVATAVFSLVLLVALTGFLQIGHLFYKGVSNAQTQDTTRQVVNDIADNLKATPATVDISQIPPNVSQPYGYFCVGAYRYTYANYMNSSLPQNGKPVEYVSSLNPYYDPTDVKVNMGLVKDRVGGGNCPAPCDTRATQAVSKCIAGRRAINTNQPTELLGNGMRVGDLELNKVSASGLYSLAVTLVYGDYSVLDYSTTPPSCAGNSSEQRFCAVNQVATSIFEGELHP